MKDRLHPLVALPLTWFACADSATPPAAPPPAPPNASNGSARHDVDPAASSPPSVATIAATLKLSIIGLRVADATANEPTESDVGRMLSIRFMPSNKACVGLPTKIKGIYRAVTVPPDRLDGDLLFAPGLTLGELTACYFALGGKPNDVLSPGPAVRHFPGVSLNHHEAFVDLSHGWLLAAPDASRAVDELTRLRVEYAQLHQ